MPTSFHLSEKIRDMLHVPRQIRRVITDFDEVASEKRNSFEIVKPFKDLQKILALQKRVYIESKFPKFDGVGIILCLYALILTTLPRRGRPHQQVPLRSSFLHG